MESLSINAIMSEYVGKSRKHCLEELVSRMHTLQSAMPITYCNDEIFKNQLLNAVKDVDTCRFAYSKPTDAVEGRILDLHLSLAIEPITTTSPALDANFVDHRYKGQRGRNLKNRTHTRQHLNCIVCKKKGCWSTNHSKEERLAELRNIRQIRQFFTDIENDDGDEGHPSSDDGKDEIDEGHLEELEELTKISCMSTSMLSPMTTNIRKTISRHL